MPARRRPGSGSLRQRGDRWISQTRDPLTGKIVSRTHPPGTTPRLAEKAHVAFLAEVGARRIVRTGVTVQQHLEQWLATRTDISPGTRLAYVGGAGRINRHIGGIVLADLTPADIDQMMVALRAAHTPQTVSQTRAVLAQALRRAVAWDRIERNPLDRAQRQRVRRQDSVVVPTVAQVQELIAAEPDSMRRAMWITVAGTGMRPGELLAMRWSAVDLDAATIEVVATVTAGEDGRQVVGEATKTRRTRPVPIGDDVVAVLAAWRREQATTGLWRVQPGRVVWPSVDDPDKPMHASTLRRHWLEACARVDGMPDGVTLKSLRHLHASVLMRSLDAQTVADRLGHGIEQTMSRYGRHATDERRRDAVHHLPRFDAGSAGR